MVLSYTATAPRAAANALNARAANTLNFVSTAPTRFDTGRFVRLSRLQFFG